MILGMGRVVEVVATRGSGFDVVLFGSNDG